MRSLLLIVLALLPGFLAGQAPSQGPRPPAKKASPKPPQPVPEQAPPAPTSPPVSGLTLDEVTQLLEAKLPEAVIIAKVRSNGKPFPLTTEQLLRLKKAGAGDNLLLVLMDPAAALAPPPPPPPDSPKEPIPGPVAQPPSGTGDPEFPKAFGVYYLEGEKWIQMPLSQCKIQRNKLRMVGGPLLRQKVHANLPGLWASVRMLRTDRPKFLAYFPDRRVSTFNLIRLVPKEKAGLREVAQISMLFSVEQHQDKIGVDITPAGPPNTFFLITKETLTPGEYAVVEPPPMSNTAKVAILEVWDFGIGEKGTASQPAASPSNSK